MKHVIKSIDETFEDINVESSVKSTIECMKFLNEKIAERTKKDVSELNTYYESKKYEDYLRNMYSEQKEKRAECRAAGKHLKISSFPYIVTNRSRPTDIHHETCSHCKASYDRHLNESELKSIYDLPKMMQRRITI